MWANLFTARTDATFQREREETEGEMHSGQQVSAAKCTVGLDGDEPLPSGLLEARLKTTPTPSPAFQLTFTVFIYRVLALALFFFFHICSFGLPSY